MVVLQCHGTHGLSGVVQRHELHATWFVLPCETTGIDVRHAATSLDQSRAKKDAAEKIAEMASKHGLEAGTDGSVTRSELIMCAVCIRAPARIGLCFASSASQAIP